MRQEKGNSVETLIDVMDEVHTHLKPWEPQIKQTMLIDRLARRVQWDFRKTKHKTLELIHITDIQWDNKGCNKERLHEYLAWVLEQDNRFILLGGDLVDAGTKLSIGSPFDQEDEPLGEVLSLIRVLAPLRHRILGYVGGNHEERGIPSFGDLGKLISAFLKIPYSPGKQHLDIFYGDHKPFKVSLRHGTGSHASTKGAIANVIYKWMMQADSQLYLIGHLHQSEILVEWREMRADDGTIKLERMIGAMGTSFLKHYGTYGESRGHRPGEIMMARTILEPNGHWEVTLR